MKEVTYQFAPSKERAQLLDQQVRRRLGTSLRYIWEQADGLLEVAPDRLDAFVQQLEGNPISPLSFSFYCDIVLAIERDDLDEATAMLQSLIALPVHPGGPMVRSLGDPDTDADAARYARFVDTDPDLPFRIGPPSTKATEACARRIEDAFRLMEEGDPELAGELRTLLREIIMASEAGGDDGTFDGASSFMLWGGIILNAERCDGRVGMVQMIAHEAAHNLVFGLCMDSPALENDRGERYASPLRTDPRPLEGIYHATYVIARMHRALHQLVESGLLTSAEKEEASGNLKRHEGAFHDGLITVRKFGRLTPTGELILKGAEAYMTAVRG